MNCFTCVEDHSCRLFVQNVRNFLRNQFESLFPLLTIGHFFIFMNEKLTARVNKLSHIYPTIYIIH